MNIRVLLVDDHRMVREAICEQLARDSDIEIVRQSGSGTEALHIVQELIPDIVVLDIALPDLSGIAVAGRIAKVFPQIGIVALSSYSDKQFVEEMLRVGARGYVVKSDSVEELLHAIHAVASGKHFLSPEITGIVIKSDSAQAGELPANACLTRRECDVLQLLARGQRALEIAKQLNITAGTVEVHRRNIKSKIGVRTTAELTQYAIRKGLLPL